MRRCPYCHHDKPRSVRVVDTIYYTCRGCYYQWSVNEMHISVLSYCVYNPGLPPHSNHGYKVGKPDTMPRMRKDRP